MIRQLGVLCLLLSCCVQQALANAPEHADIRVLIDISGSMKQNDPNNLRRPALRMLVGLMQPGTTAGVWTFARWVNNLVPVAPVDPAWKKKVAKISEQITSPGQRTNIEDVLERATRSWQGKEPRFRRHLVLLTDGVVDVDKDAVKNAASRQRIFDKLLPRFKQDQVKVHAIALSENADHALLQQVAEQTGGQYQRVDAADQLQRVFLRIFENAGRPNAVPLAGNKFVIDRSIDEATVLVFRQQGAKPTVLHAPDGQSFKTSDLPGGIAWQSDQGYDMITIGAPQAGEWRLEADVDPDNRVMVVTDLKLEVSALPNRLVVGESVPMTAHLSNKGKVIRKAAFLQKVDFSANARLADGPLDFKLNDQGQLADEKSADGRYSAEVGLDAAQAEAEVLVLAENPTFMRERRQRLTVVEPASLSVIDVGPDTLAQLVVEEGVLQAGAALALWQTGAGGERVELTAQQTGAGTWQAPLADRSWPVHARLEGTSLAGNLVQREWGPVLAPGVTPPAQVAAPEPEPAPKPKPVPEPQVEPEAEPPVAAEPVQEPDQEPPVEEEGGWIMPAVIIGSTNLLLLIGGLAFWLIRRRRGGDDHVVLIEEDDAPDTEAEDEAPQADAA